VSKRYVCARTGVPYITVTVRISGERQIAAWQAMCFVSRLRAPRLASEIVLRAIRRSQRDPGIQAVAEPLLALQEGAPKAGRKLRLLRGGAA
jgi:hypothetical protein